jgi:hypothetical protein
MDQGEPTWKSVAFISKLSVSVVVDSTERRIFTHRDQRKWLP